MDFKKTVGKTYKFYGVNDTTFKIGPHLFEAVEDPDDGYRSYMGCVNKVQDKKLVFIRRSFAQVVVEDYSTEYFKGYVLRDANTGHVWLRFGTNHTDNYYPFFVFEYKTPEQKVLTDNLRHARTRQYVFDPNINMMGIAAQDYIDSGDYDAAEDLIKKIKKEVDKQKNRH